MSISRRDLLVSQNDSCVLLSSDIFVLVLVIQLGVCLFILFADIPELYRRLDVSLISGIQ